MVKRLNSSTVTRRNEELAYWKTVGKSLLETGYSGAAPLYRYPNTMRLLLPLRGTWLTGYKVAGDRVGVFFRAKGQARSRIRQASGLATKLPPDARMADTADALTYVASIKLKILGGEPQEQIWLAHTFKKFADLFVPLATRLNDEAPISDEEPLGDLEPLERLTGEALAQALRDALF